MRFIRKKKRLVLISISVILIAGIIIFLKVKQSANIFKVKKDNFEAIISCKGEIQSEKAVLINFPDILGDRTLDIYGLQIKDMVPEGTIVKKGDYVALLDQGRIKELTQQNLERLKIVTAEYNDSKIDSAVSLKTKRDELEQLNFDLQYKKIDLEQSVYESPAYQRMAQLEYNRTVRLLDSKRRNYLMRQNGLKMRCARSEQMFNDLTEKDNKYQQALVATQITAPDDGMVIYARKWRGQKTKIGDNVSTSNPVIATLPELRSLESETYVEEIYISKIHIGDSARVYVDALKNKEMLGCISNISNIGQDMNGFDSKVFKIFVRLSGEHSRLKPSMTTTNEIIIEKVENALVIPLPCLFTENGIQYVYVKESGKISRRNVKTGERNDKVIIIKSGLKENDKILMNKPEDENI